MATNWELVRKDLETCWPDSTKTAPHCPNWELVRKEFGTFQDRRVHQNRYPQIFPAPIDLLASPQVKRHRDVVDDEMTGGKNAVKGVGSQRGALDRPQ